MSYYRAHSLLFLNTLKENTKEKEFFNEDETSGEYVNFSIYDESWLGKLGQFFAGIKNFTGNFGADFSAQYSRSKAKNEIDTALKNGNMQLASITAVAYAIALAQNNAKNYLQYKDEVIDLYGIAKKNVNSDSKVVRATSNEMIATWNNVFKKGTELSGKLKKGEKVNSGQLIEIAASFVTEAAKMNIEPAWKEVIEKELKGKRGGVAGDEDDDDAAELDVKQKARITNALNAEIPRFKQYLNKIEGMIEKNINNIEDRNFDIINATIAPKPGFPPKPALSEVAKTFPNKQIGVIYFMVDPE